MQATSEMQAVALALLSGLFGAIVGGIFSYKGAMNATKTQIDHLYRQEKERRERDKKDQLKTAREALLTEAKENTESIMKWKSYRGKFRFAIEAWNIYKPFVSSLSQKLQENLLKSYTEIQRYNTLIDYDVHAPSGHGINDAEIERRVTGAEQAISQLINELSVVPPQSQSK